MKKAMRMLLAGTLALTLLLTGCSSGDTVRTTAAVSESRETLPQKVPTHYGISLHVDDESVVATYGKLYGFEVYQLDAQDDDWVEKIIERAAAIKKKTEAQERKYTNYEEERK